MEYWKDIIGEIPIIEGLPPKEEVFNAFKFFEPLETKVVIIGQDPYHKRGVANGLSFSVNKNIKIPPSLKNIFKELKNDLDIDKEHGDLTDWAKQGVLLLNTALTVDEGKPNSHKKRWVDVTNRIIKNLCEIHPKLVFVLWGQFAIGKIPLINHKHIVITGGHPSPLNRHLKENFLGMNFFSEINKHLTYPIKW